MGHVETTCAYYGGLKKPQILEVRHLDKHSEQTRINIPPY
jgi:hypothetical protein